MHKHPYSLLCEVNNLQERKSVNKRESFNDKRLITSDSQVKQNPQTAVYSILFNDLKDCAFIKHWYNLDKG